MATRRRWQFGLGAVMILVACCAVLFAVLRRTAIDPQALTLLLPALALLAMCELIALVVWKVLHSRL